MPNSIKIILLAFGGLMLLVALLGSGFSVREISFPPMSPIIRTTTVVVGAGLMATSIVLFGTEGDDRVGPTPSPSPTTSGPSTTSPPPSSPGPSTPEPPPPDDSTPPTVLADEPLDAQALLQHVPADIRDSCTQGTRDLGESAPVYLECDPTGGVPDAVWYIQFTDTSSMNTWYNGDVDDYGPYESDSCDTGADVPGEGTYYVGDMAVGRKACYVDSDGYVNIDWTDERLNIAGMAFASPDEYAAFHDWWLEAGPVMTESV
ncbi:hypothetical protein [Streptomyces sp. HUAS ZL42]|uniref:hypothetical protein n=1 Tax=Streptomyces sp. HUAS ZL42 TaxID=3231715 RepID=UPI00345E8B75